MGERVCDACSGDGGFDEEVRDPGALYGYSSRHYECRDCGGTGYVEDDSEPMCLQDALMLDAEILRAQGVDVDDPIFFEDAEPA